MCSNEDGIILESFCDYGTTPIAAKTLKCMEIGIDASRDVCDTMADGFGDSAKVIGCKNPDESKKMNPHEFARPIIVKKYTVQSIQEDRSMAGLREGLN